MHYFIEAIDPTMALVVVVPEVAQSLRCRHHTLNTIRGYW